MLCFDCVLVEDPGINEVGVPGQRVSEGLGT